MLLVDPNNGALVSVDDEHGEFLLRNGYKRAEAEADSKPASKPASKRTARKTAK